MLDPLVGSPAGSVLAFLLEILLDCGTCFQGDQDRDAVQRETDLRQIWTAGFELTTI